MSSTDNTWQAALQEKMQQHWDYVIAVDGSATKWETPGGWCAVIMRPGGHVERIAGGCTHATNIYAEIMAWWQALTYVQTKEASKAADWQAVGLKRVLILSDCKYVADTGNAMMRGEELASSKHAAFWWGLRGLRSHGYQIEFHLVPRNVVPAQEQCHDLSNACRKLMDSLDA